MHHHRTKTLFKPESSKNLKHKVRNLRAKVHLLLPIKNCCKYEKRGKGLLKMRKNKLFQEHKENIFTTARWNNKKENQTEIFIRQSENSHGDCGHMFDKLSDHEIQQIIQDKLYYVGEENLDMFNHFLEEKERLRKKKNNRNFFKDAQEEDLSTQIPLILKPSLYSDQFTIQTTKKSNVDLLTKRLMKAEAVFAKKNIINAEKAAHNQFIKQKISQKESKAVQNFTNLLSTKRENLRQKNSITLTKAQNSIRKKCEQDVGGINLLAEQLRNVCLKRYMSTADNVYRKR